MGGVHCDPTSEMPFSFMYRSHEYENQQAHDMFVVHNLPMLDYNKLKCRSLQVSSYQIQISCVRASCWYEIEATIHMIFDVLLSLANEV